MLLLFFLIFGIYLLMISCNIKDPMIVVTLIFSSSLMILVSLSLFAGLVMRGISRLKKGNQLTGSASLIDGEDGGYHNH